MFLKIALTSLVAQRVKRLSTMWETWVQSLGWEDSLEKEMVTHSSTLALKIQWAEELGAGYCPWGRKESGMTERLHFKDSVLFPFYCMTIRKEEKKYSLCPFRINSNPILAIPSFLKNFVNNIDILSPSMVLGITMTSYTQYERTKREINILFFHHWTKIVLFAKFYIKSISLHLKN